MFQYEADKRGESVVSKLAPFSGILVADAEHRFNGVYETGKVLEAGCNARDDHRSFRQFRIRPIADDFLSWMNAVEPTLLPSEPLAIRYCKNHRDALLRFIDHPNIPIDNSWALRSVA